jgi:hypothetical protein
MASRAPRKQNQLAIRSLQVRNRGGIRPGEDRNHALESKWKFAGQRFRAAMELTAHFVPLRFSPRSRNAVLRGLVAVDKFDKPLLVKKRASRRRRFHAGTFVPVPKC